MDGKKLKMPLSHWT